MKSSAAVFSALLLSLAAAAVPALAAAGEQPLTQADLRTALEAEASPDQLAWINYQDERYTLLARSERPRDRALATISTLTKAWPPRSMVIMDAAAAAPDDLVVQWIYAEHRSAGEQSCARGGLDPAQGAKLAQLEPHNAAAHMAALEQAYRDQDEFAIDAALAVMAAGTRFDGHYLDILEAGAELFERYPLPGHMLQDPARRPFSAEELNILHYSLASGQASLLMPAYHPLSRVCNLEHSPAAGVRRLAACGDIGRLMVRAPTLLERLLGYNLLRKSGQISAAEAVAGARQRWLFEQLGPALFQHEDDLAPLTAFYRLFLETRDETAAAEYVIAFYPPPPQAADSEAADSEAED